MTDGVTLSGAGNAGFPVRARRAKARIVALASVVLAGMLSSQPAWAHLQCVPFARETSGIDIHGNARTWWHKASGEYARGSEPRVGAVMAMAASSAMPLGHVAVVSKIIDSRHILIDQANWAGPGVIEHGVLVEDDSPQGDWSEVRVWYAPAHAMGARLNPVAGFIYPEAPGSDDDDAMTGGASQIAAVDSQPADPGTQALQAFMQATARPSSDAGFTQASDQIAAAAPETTRRAS